jgi:hypothetical protein
LGGVILKFLRVDLWVHTGETMFEELIDPALKLFGFVLIGALLGVGFGFGWHLIKKREESK